MSFVTPTNLNAYLVELQEAEADLKKAQGKVESAKQAIVDTFGKDALPKEEVPETPKKGK